MSIVGQRTIQCNAKIFRIFDMLNLLTMVDSLDLKHKTSQQITATTNETKILR
jgi:hypothetical protein